MTVPSSDESVDRPLLAVARVTSLSPRSLYRYIRDTLHLHDLVVTGDPAAVKHVQYLRAVVQALELELSGETGGRRCATLLRRLTDLFDPDGTDPLYGPGDLSRTTQLQRGAATVLECLARRAGEEYEVEITDLSRGGPVTANISDDRANALSDGIVSSSPSVPPLLPIVIYLPHIRSPFNLGGILRTAAAFGVAGVVLGPDCPALSHPRTERAAMGVLPDLRVTSGGWHTAAALLNRVVPESASPPPRIVLETGGENIYTTRFPPTGVLVAGHEQFGLPEEEVTAARAAGEVVTIPHGGPKSSLNVGVAVGIALSWWEAGTR